MRERSAHGALTLAREYYTSHEIFERERRLVFGDSWLYTGHRSTLRETGSYYAFSAGDDSVLVVRGADGEVRAFHNVCRHRGTRLCDDPAGRFTGRIQCPYHAWTYALDGHLKAAPNMEDVAGFETGDYPLLDAPVAVVEGMVFVRLAAGGHPFEEELAPLLGKLGAWRVGELESVHSTVYDVAANWKLFFQNYSECYHCPTVHPVLNRLTPYRDTSNDLESGPFLGGPMTMARGRGSSMTLSGRACAPPLGGLAEDDLDKVYYYTIFPNMFLSLHPDYVLIHRGEPLAADRTRIHCDWYFHPDAIASEDFDPSEAIEFWDMTNRQDWELCRLSQEGIRSSAYRPGPYSELESQLAAFDRHYLTIMERE